MAFNDVVALELLSVFSTPVDLRKMGWLFVGQGKHDIPVVIVNCFLNPNLRSLFKGLAVLVVVEGIAF